MAYVDRFLIGSLISLAAVAYYATSYEVATKLLILPAAVVSVLFPAFSTALVSDRKKAGELFRYSLRLIMMSLFPLSLTIVLLAKDGLAFWLGLEFATKSFAALQWLAVGAFTNGVAFVPFCFLQASGRPDLTGKLNLLELPIYLVALWYFTAHYGIIGAALAWALRVTVDCVLLLWLASTITGNKSTLYWFATFTTCLSMMIWLATQFQSIQIKVWVIALCLCILIYLISRGIIPMRRASCASSE
jgi:O-antigen/teichoic acid export membrane protein